MIPTPQQLEETAMSIVTFWENSQMNDNDKKKILEMTRDYYAEKNEFVFDQYLSELCNRQLNKYAPPTGFETAVSSETTDAD